MKVGKLRMPLDRVAVALVSQGISEVLNRPLIGRCSLRNTSNCLQILIRRPLDLLSKYDFVARPVSALPKGKMRVPLSRVNAFLGL